MVFKFIKPLILCIFLPVHLVGLTQFYLDVRLSGESLFGGKRIFHLYSKAPEKYAALCLVEYKTHRDKRIEPLLAHEYHMFFLASGVIFYVPKHDVVVIRSLVYNQDGDLVKNLGLDLAKAQYDFPKQISIIQEMLMLSDRTMDIELFAHNNNDFCDRLKSFYPHGPGWPCCAQDANEELPLTPLPTEGEPISPMV